METQAGWALVIDNDEPSHSLYQSVLGEMGFSIEICTRSAQVPLALSRRSFELLIIDPNTAGPQSVNVLAQLYRQVSPASVIVVGCNLLPDIVETSMHDGGPGLLNRPWSAEQLREMIVATTVQQQTSLLGQVIHAPGSSVRATVESDLQHLYQQIVRIILARFTADRVSLMLWNDGSDFINVVASEGFPFALPGERTALLYDSLSGWVIRHMEPLLLEPDVALPFDMQNSWRNATLCAGMCAPLAVRGRVLGVLTAARRCDQAPYTSGDLDEMVELTYQAAWVLDFVQSQLHAHRRTQFLVRLYNLSNALLAVNAASEVEQIVVAHLSETLPEARGYLFLRESDSPGINSIVALNRESQSHLNVDILHDDPGLVGQVLADGIPRMRQSSNQRELAAWEQQLASQRDRVLCCAALKTDASVYGAIEIVTRPLSFGEDELQYLVAAATLIAPVLEKVQRHAAVKWAADRYSTLFQSASDAILLIDMKSMTIVLANAMAERLSGYSQADLILIAPNRLIAPGRTGRSTPSIADLLAGNVTEYEGYLHTRSGYNIPVSFAPSVVSYANARYLLLLIRNNTEAQRHAQQLAQQEKLSGMTRLTASIAHEINNPLQALHNTLHLLLNRPFTEEKRERLLSMAQMEVNRMTEIVRRMLDLHRPAAEDMRPSSVHSLLDGALSSAAPQLQHHHVLIERDWFAELPRVLAIGGHLKQAFYDLIVNAVEAMPDGGRLIIRTRAEENGSPLQQVLIDFIDSGPGISENEAKLIFEPFYSTKRTGLGLGLAVSYSIVERHGGSLSVSSSASGSTFHVALPAAPVAEK